ncbi:MAG: hypothetical protein HQK56_08055 [Deltaproteobacteria bacterium]|nr:hypothetical protein [Deltaproteobacteria bacterium]
MILKGILHVESPIYRGNSRKTLFTRDGDGVHKLVSLAGEISGTAQSLMDAFIGQSGNGKNFGLLNRMWLRLYGSPLPPKLITNVKCTLQTKSYPRDNFFDLRMGLKLDEDRFAAEANANYKMETILRNSIFDLTLSLDEPQLRNSDNEVRLYYLLQEMKEGRFWFGAGKTKGLGRVRLDMELPFPSPEKAPKLNLEASHLRVDMKFDSVNPVLVGWNWGKVDQQTASFTSVEARLMIEAMKDIPGFIRGRLEMILGGPILSPEDWKRKLAEFLPRIIAIWLMERSTAEVESYVLPKSSLSKLGKGKHALTEKLLVRLEALTEQPFPSQDAAEDAVKDALGKKANMANRVIECVERKQQSKKTLDKDAWLQLVDAFGFDTGLSETVAVTIHDELALTRLITTACRDLFARINLQIDHQIKLLQSDIWVDAEMANRQEHIRIKTMLLQNKISEDQWNNPRLVPDGVKPVIWKEFLESHSRVQYRHMLASTNLNKSIINDRNLIEFLKVYRNRTRQELAQPCNIDFRPGPGKKSRDISKKYGKPFDTMFMRMLSWVPSSKEQGAWEVYIPGGTIKGAFRKRASQLLKTLWGESAKTSQVINRLFGVQGQRGMVMFSDAYLVDPFDPHRAWCSMEGIKINPKTGQPIETSKHDYLFAYGDKLSFQLRLDAQDVTGSDTEAFSILAHLINDFQKGDICIGGEKTAGFGWVQAEVTNLNLLSANLSQAYEKIFGSYQFTEHGPWQQLRLEGAEAAKALSRTAPIISRKEAGSLTPPMAKAGFISHRAFGGRCGTLAIEAEVLTPTNIKESGEPSFNTTLEKESINGWDFFSLSAPEAAHRGSDRIYALPSRSIKGMIRYIYSIITDSRVESTDIAKLNPADSLFGWVGTGPNQALMGRLSFSFGMFQQPRLSWFKVPYPYSGWEFNNKKWKNTPGLTVPRTIIADSWRVFGHAALAPIVTQLDDFTPDAIQANYFRAILPGSRARFTVRFWNLEDQELRRLLWSLVLEPNIAHKLGNNKHMGFGSLRFKILPESFLIDWSKRYAGGPNEAWQMPVQLQDWVRKDELKNYAPLCEALNANGI